MELVGFTAKRATIAWPVEMPPRMPPAWFELNRTRPSSIRMSSALSSPEREAAAKIPHPVFQVVGEVRVARPERRGDRAVIARALVDIVDHEGDRRAGRHPLEHARQDADLIRFLALRGEFRPTRSAAIQPGLQI